MVTPRELIEVSVSNLLIDRLEQWEVVRRLCESPIEELFLAAVFGSNIGRHNPVHIYAGPYRDEAELFPGGHLWPQSPVGKYRVDFLFAHIDRHGRRLVAVECDGHDFHEKTKEQAAHDKARDRYLVARGIQVLRFTGSEIYRDPDMCWTETFNVLWDAAAAA